MYCSECGQPLSDGSKFCSRCGSSLSAQNRSVMRANLEKSEESIKYIQKSISVALTGDFKEDIETAFKAAIKIKRFEDVLCDLIFTNKYVYLVPATKNKGESGWRTLALLGGPLLVGVGDYLVEKGINAFHDKAKRPLDHREIVDPTARQAVPHWLFDEVSLSVYEQPEGIPFFSKTNAVNFVLKGPANYLNRIANLTAHFKIYGSILNPGSFGFGYERPKDFDPLAKIFHLKENDITIR